jgi:hypothetical protein
LKRAGDPGRDRQRSNDDARKRKRTGVLANYGIIPTTTAP